MNPLPALRTIRENSGSASASPAPHTDPPILPPECGALPSAGRTFATDALRSQILSPSEVVDVIRRLGLRCGQLQSRETAADAFVALGALTRFQATRVLSGQTHGLVFGPYRVRDRVNSGSVGVVFLAEHPALARTVAVKVMAQADDTHPDVVQRFATEVRVLARLDSPYIVSVYDTGVLPGSAGHPPLHYLVMEYLPGGDVEDFVYAHGAQPIGTACAWARHVAAGMRAIHASGLTHRDIKPSNMLLTDSRTVKLCDFGLAREFGGTRTQPKALLGSLEFMAPEQWADAATAGPPADVYGLGVTLFWVLTGQLPCGEAKSMTERVEAVRMGTPRRLREMLPKIPADLDELVARMLDRNPVARPGTSDVIAGLARFASASLLPAAQDEPIILDDDTEIELLRGTIRQLEDVVVRAEQSAETAATAVLTGLTAAAAARPGESAPHQLRVAGYSRVLATKLAGKPEWAMFAGLKATGELAGAAAAHDLGRVATDDDTHTSAGDDLLATLARDHGPALPFLRVLRSVVRHHHERWDGAGFPDRLAGEAIPHAARIVAVADTYDTLRGSSGLSHEDAVQKLTKQSGVAFDPTVVAALRACEEEIGRIHFDNPDPGEAAELLAVPEPSATPLPSASNKSSRSLGDILGSATQAR